MQYRKKTDYPNGFRLFTICIESLGNAATINVKAYFLSSFGTKGPFGGIDMAHKTIFVILTGFIVLSGCTTTQGPTLIQNDHYMAVGEIRAGEDIENCKSLAETYISENTLPRWDRDYADEYPPVVFGGGIGTTIGSYGGRFGGGSGFGIGMGVLPFSSGQPRPRPSKYYTDYVDDCLRQMGYEPAGWP